MIAPAISSTVTGGKLVDKFDRAFFGQVFDECVLVELEHRRRPARGEAFRRSERELAVGRSLADFNLELAPDAVHDFVRAAQSARQIRTNVEQVAADRLAMEHRIE